MRRDAGLSVSQRADLRADAGVKFERGLGLPNAELVTVPDAHADRALATLNADPDVQYAAANVPLKVASFHPPSDTYYRLGLQRDLEQPNDADIDIMSAWSHEGWAGLGTGVDVGVVDQQIWTGHRDLLGQINTTLATDVLGTSGCQAPVPTGRNDHGTHVAGTIVAAHNGVDVAGIAPDARVVPIRAFDNCGSSSLATVIKAFGYAGEKHLPIVVGSFSTDPLEQTDSAGTDRAFSDLFKTYSDTLFIVAAGNEGSRNDERPVFPCETHGQEGVDPANVICVAMTDREDRPSCQSNVGGSVDLFAPGELIPSTVMNPITSQQANGVISNSGTSMSAAVVAGVAALARSAQPDASATLLKGLLLASVDTPEGLEVGRINAAKAVGEPGPGEGGPGDVRGWDSCDEDHDGTGNVSDKCLGLVGHVAEGCPDSDADGIHEGIDNCKTVANSDQADMDGDTIGDACDPDVDGDTLAESSDRCPRVAARTFDGCPAVVQPPPDEPDDGGGGGIIVVPPIQTPAPTPSPVLPTIAPPAFTAFTAKVTPSNCKAGPRCKKVAKLTLKLSRTAKVSLKVERKKGKSWKRFTSRSVTVTTALKSLMFRGKGGRTLDKGTYRVIATISGGPRETRTFRVV